MCINRQNLTQNCTPACFFLIYYAAIALVVYLMFSPRDFVQNFLEHFEGFVITLLFSGVMAAGILFISILPLMNEVVFFWNKGRGYLSEVFIRTVCLLTGLIACFLPQLLLKYAYAISQATFAVRVSDTLLIALTVLLVTFNHFKAAALLRRKQCLS
tara:strand:- start:626 stop:1096 length:471 start_codon:yes stop_codon:yes gene_type:complete